MKAYDLKVLLEMLKKEGLDIAEDAAEKLVSTVLLWLEESAKESDNVIDDMGLIVLPKIKEFILGAVDKIDGKEG